MVRVHLVAALGVLLLFVYEWSRLVSATRVKLELGRGLRQDAEALQAFRQKVEHDPSGALEGWGVHSNPCRWRGVECTRVAAAATAVSDLVEERVVGLELWGLELEGSISSQIGRLSQLQKLAIVGKRFTGAQIPAGIQNCRKLSTVDLRSNELARAIGFSLAYFPHLEVLKLAENQLTGTLGVLFTDKMSLEDFELFWFVEERSSKEEDILGLLCPKLEVLDLAQNSLPGKLPTAMGRCSQLREIRLNDNSFSGAIPLTLSAIFHLRSLLLNTNLLDWNLPAAMGFCQKLQFLNVADNYLRGQIPVEFASLGGEDQRFDFSNNMFEDPIPLGQWDVQELTLAEVFLINPGLCGWPFNRLYQKSRRISIEDGLSLQFPPSLISKIVGIFDQLHFCAQTVVQVLVSAHANGGSGFVKAMATRRSMAQADAPASGPTSAQKQNIAQRWGVGLAVGLLAGAISAVLLATVLRLGVFCVRSSPHLQGPIIFHPNISPKMLRFLEKDESLKESELVGVGGAARVYKAQLENDMVVAVKSVEVKEDQKGLFGQRQIQAELETLGCIRHRNLAVLLAYVHRPDCHLLLYEYMQNGSLHHALQKLNARELEIPWPIRHKIAVGICQGLSYLHFHSSPRIVHRDLKPSNILLDAKFTAHISDFGLAKVVPGADTHVTTRVAGTVGYIAPEYSQTCRFTDKSDVYSFGVVLAVLLTGKDPTDQFFHSMPGGSIGSWLHDLLLKGEAKEAIDPRLVGTGFEEEILLAIRIAVFCTDCNPSDRPASQEVLVMLNQIRKEEEPI